MFKYTLGLVEKLVIAKAILAVLNELVTLVVNVHELLHVVLHYSSNRLFITMEMWKHKFQIKKDKWVYVPSNEMLRCGIGIHQLITSRWRVPLYYYHHMRDGGHVAAARIHVKNQYFALIDIRNFFKSTSQSRVTRELKTLIPYVDARKIAKISTVRVPGSNEKKYALPYGFPQSPILATLCLCNSYAGRILDSISKSGLVKVSVYMDDIILSSNGLDVLEEKYVALGEALKKSRYAINEDKTQAPSKCITVFNLELSHNSLRVTPRRLVEFLQAYAQSKNEHERKGIATYVHSVNAGQADRHFPEK